MSRAGAQHLGRRRGIYGIRVRVPDDIRPLLGMIEVFSMIKNDKQMLASENVRAMVASCFRDMIFDAVNFTKQTNAASGSNERPLPSVSVEASEGVTLKEAIGCYLATKQSDWRRKTYESRRRRLTA